MLTSTFQALCFSLILTVNQGLQQAGVSLNILSNIGVKSVGWQKIQGWQHPVDSGHVVLGTYLKLPQKADVHIPFSGIYLAFVTVTLTGADVEGKFETKLVINDKLNNSQNGMTSSVRGGPLGPKSLSIKGALFLQCNDYVSVYAYSELDSDWSVSGQSETTFSLQYIAAIGAAPGFSAVFTEEKMYNSSGWISLRNWRSQQNPGSFKSMTGFSKDVGEFVSICDGVYFVSANVLIKTNATKYFHIGIAVNSHVNGSTVRKMASSQFTVSIAITVVLKKGDITALKVNAQGAEYIVGAESSFTAVKISSQSAATPGFSTVFESEVVGSGGGWTQISLSNPNGSSYGQFNGEPKYIVNGRYYPPKNGIYIVSANVHVVAESLISGTIFSRAISGASLNGNILGVVSTLTKTDYGEDVTFTTAGTIQLLTTQYPLSFYIYMQNAGKYRILTGSRISVVMAEVKYPAFHVTLETDVPQYSDNAWVEISAWKVNKATGSFSLTNSLSPTNGRYTVEVSGVYHVSANIIYNAPASVISLLISANGGQSKRSALFSTKGNPANKDVLSVSGAMRLKKGDFVSVLTKVTGASSWSVADKSSFSLAFIGLPFSVPGFSAVFASTKSFSFDGWHQMTGLIAPPSAGPMFHYGGGLDVAQCKYQVPLPGLYAVSANLKLKSATNIGAEFTANAAVDNNPGSSSYLNGMNDFVSRSVSLGSEDFYSLNIAGVVRLKANQSLTLWIKSTSAGAWQLSEDSNFGVIMIHADSDFHSSGFQAALDPFVSQTVTGASNWKLIRSWVTLRSGSAKGLFNIDKYQDIAASSGTVTIRQSGLYFISALITLKDAAGKFEVGVHLQSRLAGLYSVIDSSRLSHYTVKLFGMLFIAEGQTLSMQVKAPLKKTWEQDKLYCGLSFVKVAGFVAPSIIATGIVSDRMVALHVGNWTRLDSWASSKTPSQLLTGTSFVKSSGVFAAQNSGTFIVSGFLEAETNQANPTVEMKISVNADLSQVSVQSIGNGLSTVHSHCNKSCMLYVSGVLSLKASDTVAMFVRSDEVRQMTIKNASMFSISMIAESYPVPNGMSGLLSSLLSVNVKGNKQITGWKILPSSGNFFGSRGNMDNYDVQETGIYFVSINIKFRNVIGIVKAFTSLVNIPAITSLLKQDSDSVLSLSVSGCMKISAGSQYTVTVYSETDSNYEILPGSSKSILFLGQTVIGFTATQMQTRTINLVSNTANHITKWTILGKDWLFESGSGFSDRKTFIVPTTGVYFISSHIIVAVTTNSSDFTLSLGIQLDGFMNRENGLFSTNSASRTTKTTLVITGSVYLQKWTQLKLVMFASRPANVEINIDSTFSVVKTSKELNVPSCSDNGPNIIGSLEPSVMRTSFKKSVGWQCEAVGKSVAYSWLKNYQPLPGEIATNLNIASTKVSDTGEYVCAATHDGIRVTSNIAKLTIYDPVPVFLNPKSEFNVHIPENGQPVLSVLDIQARARSLVNAFAMMSFQIITGNINNTFSLNPTQSDKGVTLLRRLPLDREKIENYTIVIKATNLEAYSVSFQEIYITVKDLNDNPPVFTQAKYESSIFENATVGTTVARVLATDEDIGENSVIKYWFIPSSAQSVFEINPSTGYVTLKGPVDRETRDLYVIFVRAYDKSFSVYSELSIRILDINEHAPVFKPDRYVVNVSETILPGSSVVMVTASDRDTGANADLTYEIIAGDPDKIFRITKYGLVQNQKTLNYEQNKSFVLEVSVRDNGQPHLNSNKTATVVITVTDANDNSPKFEKADYVVWIYENATIGDLILTVRANDKDAPGQPESTLTYAIEGTNKEMSMFVLNSTTGSIKLNGTFDYETTRLYRFTVTAKDAGIPSLQDKSQLQINVLDVNDNKPRFHQLYFAINVTETSQINRQIFKVTAFDEDANSNAEVRYYLQSGNVGNTFTIDPISGIVIAIKPLDRERTRYYSLLVNCKDMGNPPLEASASLRLEINILDENDNSPIFDSARYSEKISENAAIGSLVLEMNVTDPDEGPNGQFSLNIVENSARKIFEYNQSRGGLILKKRLDFEAYSVYHFTVIAKDHGIPALEKSALVDVHVTDLNDNAPRFAHAQYDTQVQDMVFANVTIFQMIATDPDLGESGKIVYEIVSGNSDGQFKIGKYTGIIETAKYLNTTFITKFELEVIAKDGFSPPAVSNRTLLNIHVIKTPAIRLSNLRAGTKSLEAAIDVSEFSYLQIIKYHILVQEYKPQNVNFNIAGSLPPIKWYGVNIKQSGLNEIRRYVALVISAKNRKRRAIDSNIKNIVIGTEAGCEKKTDDFCNGPLKPNTMYRLQVRGFTLNSKFPRDSHFSVPITLGKSAATTAKLSDPASKDGTIGLAIAFAVSTILSIIILAVHVQYKRKHQVLNTEHVHRHMDVLQSQKYMDQLTPRSGFGALSDIGIWPEMSMAETSHMYQRSQQPKDHKIPRSPGDSGINHGNDDADSWKLNTSDDGEESWEVREHNHHIRDRTRLISSQPSTGFQALKLKSDSNTSLETNEEHFHLPRFSDGFRDIFRNEENKNKVQKNSEVQKSRTGEEIETEIETEFGPEIETTLGADVDLSSIDEENTDD